MSITNELRLFAADPYTGWVPTDKQQADLRAMADRIDAEHQKALDEWKAKHGQMWLKGYAECHAELLEGNETLASDLESCGWIRLPVDADGIPVHIDDVMEWPDGRTFEVVGIGDGTLFYVDDGSEYADWTGASTKRHHHVPTVEDVLREMHAELDEVTALYVGEAIDSDERDRDEARIFAEYAKRLTLAGDAE
jgi:hypothetical protein